MEDKIITQFRYDLHDRFSEKKISMQELIREAIQFGSQLTVERAKEKVMDILNDESPMTSDNEILQAIKESAIK